MSTQLIARSDWDAVCDAFGGFFADAGETEVDEGTATFRAAITGFTIARDGTSRSFMPLHSVELGWEEVAFDRARHEVRLIGPSGTYTYVLPPDLR